MYQVYPEGMDQEFDGLKKMDKSAEDNGKTAIPSGSAEPRDSNKSSNSLVTPHPHRPYSSLADVQEGPGQ